MDGLSRFFRVKSGVRQECILILTLFNTCNDWNDYGLSMGDAKITDLEFSADVAIFTKTLEVIVHVLNTLSMELE